MNPWNTYLLDLLGKDQHGRARVDETMALLRSLRSRRLAAQELLRVLDWVKELDAFRQVFILPTVLTLLGDTSRSLRSRVLRFAGDLLGAASGSLLTEIEALGERERDPDEGLRSVLDGVAAIVSQEYLSGDHTDARDLTTLLDDRVIIFGIALFNGLFTWLEAQPDCDRLRQTYANFFHEDERDPLRKQLYELMLDGSIFVRHLLVDWVGQSGVDLSSEISARPLLFQRYRDDLDPVVGAAAIEAYARRTVASEIATTVDRLESELRTFSERGRRFGHRPAEGARTLTCAVLRAVGFLAETHPAEPEPRALLRRVVATPPTMYVDLLMNRRAKAHVGTFETALALHGDLLRFRIRSIRRDHNEQLVGDLGPETVALEEPPDSLQRDAQSYWCELSTDPAADKRRFRLLKPFTVGTRTTGDLLAVISPRVDSLASWNARRPSPTLHKRCELELASRATWSCVAVEAVSRVLVASRAEIPPGDADSDSGALLTFLFQTAEAAEHVWYDEKWIGKDGIELRNRTRSILLNQFATDAYFERLFAGGEADPLRAQLLCSLATAALRSLDTDVAYRWIHGNLDLLRWIAEKSDYRLYDRACAAGVVQLRILGISEANDPIPIVIDCEIEHLRADTRRALAFVTDDTFQAVHARLDAGADHDLLMARPEDARDAVDQIAVRAEFVARYLERGDERWGSPDIDIAICLAAAASPSRGLLSDTARRRLAAAYALAPAERRGGQARRLYEQLLRTATGAQLAAAIRWVQRSGEYRLQDYLGRLMDRRLHATGAARLQTGRWFDTQTIIDLAAQRTVPLAYVLDLARRDPSFVRDYMIRRRQRIGRGETDRVLVASGPVRRLRGMPLDVVPAELRAVRRGAIGQNVTEGAADVVPSFIYQAGGETEVRCLAALRRVPRNSLDLHLRSLPPIKRRALLDEFLTDRPRVQLVARVAGVGPGGTALLDLGVTPAGLSSRVEVELGLSVDVDEIVVVQVTRRTEPKLIIKDGRFHLRPDACVENATDLREHPAPVAWLEAHAPGRQVLLVCNVAGVFKRPDGRVRCFLDAGFRLFAEKTSEERLPTFVASGKVAPRKGTEVVVAASGLHFFRDARQIVVQDSIEPLPVDQGFQENQRVVGSLRPERAESGRLAWFADLGGVRLTVPRSEVTRDLRRLLELDDLEDDAPFLERVRAESFEFQVLAGGQRTSLIKAEPSWDAEDLMVALESGAVGDVTVVSFDSRTPRGMVVEVESSTPMADDVGDVPVLSVGTLAHLSQGELFDQDGELVLLESLSPGTRLSLAVRKKQPEADRALWQRPRPAIHLRLAEDPDKENLSFETLFSKDDVLKVRMADDGVLELVDAFEGLPRPALALDEARDRAFFPPDLVLDAAVTRTWNPWSTSYSVSVGRVRARILYLDQTRLSQDVRFYLHLKPGDMIGGRSRRYLYEHRNLFCYANSLRVAIDPLALYLQPDLGGLRPEAIDAPVVLTEVSQRKPAPRYDSFPADSIQELAGRGAASGLVYGTPFPNSGSTQINVLWVLGDPNDETANDDTLQSSFEPNARYFNGDVLSARLESGRVVVDRRSRILTGTFLHTPKPFRLWLKKARRPERNLVTALLLKRPESADGRWLFCFEPADLVEVQTELLGNPGALAKAHALDKVRLRLVRNVNGKDALQVEATADGDLALAQQGPFKLHLHWYHFETGTFDALLEGGKPVAEHPPLKLQLRHSDVPPGHNIRHLIQNIRSRPVIRCTLEGFELRATYRDSMWQFHLDCRLGHFQDTRPEQSARIRKPSLAEALAERGRIDGAQGRLVEHGGADAVVLSAFDHPSPVPLPLPEQTWVEFTGLLPNRTGRFAFAVLRAEDGTTFASLRRNRPKPLAEWLDQMGYRASSKTRYRSMRYFGALSEKDRIECGIDTGTADKEPEPAELILFELGPGETVVAPTDQLRFLGEPFDPKSLHAGDEITAFQIVGCTGPTGNELILDIMTFILDIVPSLDSFKNGSLFGRIEVVGDRVEIIELRGVSYSEQAVSPRRFGRWKRVLTGTTDEDLKRLRDQGPDQLVYLQYVRADKTDGVLIFRLATTAEVFQRNNFVYVVGRGVASYGAASMKLNVRPLDQTFEGDYFIPDNLFSERRGRLQDLDHRRQRGIFLARVQDVPIEGAWHGGHGSSYKLSLLENPRRRFRYLMNHQEWQVIVKDRSPDGRSLLVEAGIGVNVELPLHRIRLSTAGGRGEMPRVPSCGEILFLERVWEERCLVIRDSVRCHVDYLEVEERPLVLTTLWGSKAFRRRKLEKGGHLDCNVVGLPQIHGSCQVEESLVESDDAVPQRVERRQGGNSLLLTDRLGESKYVVGYLRFEDTGQPRFDTTNTGKTYRLSRSETTSRHGSLSEIERALADQAWRDNATGRDRRLADSYLIGVYLPQQDSISLTAMSHRPFPVDHLVEQFAHPRTPRPCRDGSQAEVRSFVVARAEDDRLILEIAPGRFAELPTEMIRPLHGDGKLAAGNTLSWHRLAAGDEIDLALLPVRDTDAFLPRFRVRELTSRAGRQLGRPVIAPLCRRDDQTLVFGSLDGPWVSAPDIGALLRSEIRDLRKFRRESGARNQELKRLVDRFRSRLVLEGTVAGSTEVRGGTLFFIGIGIAVPTAGGEMKDPAHFVPSDQLALKKGDRVGVRVLEARFDGTNLTGLEYAVELDVQKRSNEILVRGSGERFTRAQKPTIGDSVLIYRPEGAAASEVVAAGFERLKLFWRNTEGDDLHLHNPSGREDVFEALLSDGGSFWATCEGIGQRGLEVSRRIQLEDVVPGPGEVVRAKVIRALSASRWLIRLHEVPMVLSSQRFFRGPTSGVAQLSDELARSSPRGLDIEVLRAADGRLSATEVYTLPVGEFAARIETVVQGGILAVGAGNLLFVPTVELAWCGALDEPLLRTLFERGTSLRVTRHGTHSNRWSHIATYDIRTDVAEMIRRPGAVSVEALERHGTRTVVRGSSGVLMELTGDPSPKPGTRVVAFVQQVDEVNRCISLAPEETPRRRWNLRLEQASGPCRVATYSDVTFRMWIGELESEVRTGGVAAAYAWAARRPSLDLGPDTIRVVLDTIAPEKLQLATGDLASEEAETDLQRLLRRIASALAQRGDDCEPCESEIFALGYQLLLDQRPEDALARFQKIEHSTLFKGSFSARLALAVAYAQTGKENASVDALCDLFDRLWSNAVRTFAIPLVEPIAYDPQDTTRQQWSQALKDNDLERLEAIFGQQPAAFKTSSSGLVFPIWRAIIEGREVLLDDLADRFFDALLLDLEESIGSLDQRVFAMAAFLEFSRGEIPEAWGWLGRVEPSTPDLAVPAFWHSYLAGSLAPDLGLDPVLVAAEALYKRSRWHRNLDFAQLEELWTKFRASRHRWVLDMPTCKPIPPLPTRDERALRQWVQLNGVEPGLDALFDEAGIEASA